MTRRNLITVKHTIYAEKGLDDVQLANQPLTCDFCCSEGSGLPIWPAKDSRDHEDLMNATGKIEKANESMHIEIGKTSSQ